MSDGRIIRDEGRAIDSGGQSFFPLEGAKAVFKRILVPLDGSDFAERALSAAARIARATDGSIVLFGVATTPVDYGPYIARSKAYAEAVVQNDLRRVREYLLETANSPTLAGIGERDGVCAGRDASPTLDYPPAQGKLRTVPDSAGEQLHRATRRYPLEHCAASVRRWLATLPESTYEDVGINFR